MQKQNENVYSIELVDKKSIFHYSDNIDKFIKIVLYYPKHVSMLRDEFEKGFKFFDLNFENMTYESKINFPLRFMIDNGITGMSWIELPKGKYKYIPHKQKISTCQIEVTIQ